MSFLCGTSWPPSSHAHGHTFLRSRWFVYADKEKYNRIARFFGLFHKLQFRAPWIGENGFEREAFALRQQFPSDLIRDVCGFIGFQSQLLGQFVCVYKAKAVRTQVSVIERALTGAVRPGQDQQNRSSFKNFHRARAAIAARALKGALETLVRFGSAVTTNCRFLNRPTVLMPSVSVRISIPLRVGCGSKCGKGRLSRYSFNRALPSRPSTDSTSSGKLGRLR